MFVRLLPKLLGAQGSVEVYGGGRGLISLLPLPQHQAVMLVQAAMKVMKSYGHHQCNASLAETSACICCTVPSSASASGHDSFSFVFNHHFSSNHREFKIKARTFVQN